MKADAIVAGVGQLTGAAGQIIGGLTAGTAECGARPLLAKNREKWDECVAKSVSIREQQTAMLRNAQSTNEPEKKSTNKFYIVAGVVVVIVLILVLIKKK